MSVELLERGAAALGDLVEEVALVGGAAIPLWIADPAAPPPRPTKDVDVIIEVITRSAYYGFEDRLREGGFATTRRSLPVASPRARSRTGRDADGCRATRADIVALVDGREELPAEIRKAPGGLVEYLGDTLRRLLANDQIVDGIRAQLLPDTISQDRAEDVVLVRLDEIAGGPFQEVVK